MARGVDQVDHVVAVAELQRGRGDRDAALALDLHPVRHVPRRSSLPCTAPARAITRACRARASVSVDLPASGWLITANDRRREASVVASEGAVRATPVALIGSVRPATSRVPPHWVLTSGPPPVATAMVHPPRACRQESAAAGRAAQGCSASNSASATTSSSASRRRWPRIGLQHAQHARGALAPDGQVAELPPPQGLVDPAGLEVPQAVGQRRRPRRGRRTASRGRPRRRERVDDLGVVVDALEHVGQALRAAGRRPASGPGSASNRSPGRRR